MNILPDLYVSVNSKPYHPPPSGNPRENFQNLSNPNHPGKFFCQMSFPPGFPGTLYYNKFYAFHPFLDLNLKLLNEYLQIWRKNIYLSMKDMQKCKSLNLICISCFRSNALPSSNPYSPGHKFWSNAQGVPGGWQCLELTGTLHESSPGLKPRKFPFLSKMN